MPETTAERRCREQLRGLTFSTEDGHNFCKLCELYQVKEGGACDSLVELFRHLTKKHPFEYSVFLKMQE